MNADILEKISYISFLAAVLFVILAIILFFKFHVYALMNDLSGKRAKRQIQAYRENNMGLQYLDYYRQATTSIDESTIKLGTTLLDEHTAVLMEEATMSLNEGHEADGAAYVVVLDEMAVHTGERIS